MSDPPKKMGMSLYADLLEPSKTPGATISGAPVRYDNTNAQEPETAPKKKQDASLKFQPIKRPQAQQKNKSKTASSAAYKFSSSSAAGPISTSSPDRALPASTPQQPQSTMRPSNFDDWVDEHDEDAYNYQERVRNERAGKRQKKKNKNKGETRVWDWDDVYDPTMPNSYADYKGSEEQYREIRDWKARLYYHQLKAKRTPKAEGSRSDEEQDALPSKRRAFPPPGMSFAPPKFDDDVQSKPPPNDDDDYDPPTHFSNDRYDEPVEPRAGFSHTLMQEAATGDDAYERRMRMSEMQPQSRPIPQPVQQQVSGPQQVISPPPPPPPSQHDPASDKAAADIAAKKAEALAKIAAMKAKLEANKPMPQSMDQGLPPPPPPPPPPINDSGISVSRAPVRYDAPPEADATPDQETVRSNRPGQKGFAERLMKKYGWEKGQGLGAQNDGIATPIIARAQKRKKRSDADGGGWAAPANMGKIVGGKRRKIEKTSDDDGQFGAMSSVIKLEGMLDGLDVDYEISEGNLMQEIGDEMGGKYGNIERLFIWHKELGGNEEVFVKFTSQLSALRAVNATDGMTFADNPVVARFFPEEKFGNGVYV